MSLREHLRDALTSALRARDTEAVSALRSALAAISNAEAVPSPPLTGTEIVLEVGPTEVPRRELTDGELVDVVRREIDDREAAAVQLNRHGQSERAARLVREAAVLAHQLER